MGLIARALELKGIATTLTSNNPGMTRPILPPRALFTKLAIGATLGKPHDGTTQKHVLTETLSLLKHDAPIEYVKFVE